ncbi:OLC1v1020299C1 [Oldenlandia corymbosa var. corymbosa]|uniref:Peroxidase n=1 Tax=Oldenlandia corymbosa var. corymbosa TaxID=529605 RepID=A0AAV1EG97_OLDCO|nr:OLC1v1020299C1 [Oldenlandia corymbosa var. corymbosa]
MKQLSFMLLLSLALLLVSTIGVTNAGGLGRGGGRGGGNGGGSGGVFGMNFYRSTTCPQAENLVRQATRSKVRSDPTLAAKILRVHYHDCFVRGCDASILLDTVGTNQSEKDARPNLTLGGFEAIDDIKAQVEQACPGVVSCADILALAARDAVSFPFGRDLWPVPTGRKDGKVSLIGDVTGNLPSPFSDFTTLKQLFAKKNLDVNDLVALSGAHTIGVAHCGAFSRRLFNFTGKGDQDPSLDPVYAETLKQKCPNPANPATVVGMDPGSPGSFDNSYFRILKQNEGLFQSDAALLTDPTSTSIVNQLQFPGNFFGAFARSMVNMGSIGVITGADGEIRKNCRVVN